MMLSRSVLFVVCCLLFLPVAAVKANETRVYTISSPDKKVQVVLEHIDQRAYYSISYDKTHVLERSLLGLRTDGADFTTMTLERATKAVVVRDQYETVNAKKSRVNYEANRQVFQYRSTGGKMDICFQVSNDGVVFRYEVPEASGRGRQVTEELTSFKFPLSARAWLQPVAVAKSGWEHTNPSYEEHYLHNIPVGTPEKNGTGWVYPALFQSNNTWVLITEAGLDGTYCATRLQAESPEGNYQIGFPDPREVMPSGGLKPQIEGHFVSPWRIITVGSLATIVESTLGLDVADKAIALERPELIKPGKSSWSWINSKDDHIVYDEQKKYIDFAAEMKWQYCLIDVNWDRKIGYEKIQELVEYARTRHIGILLWYNSAGDWNTVGYTPKNKLLTRESREAEFGRIRDMGVKGVKIDFFGGDGQSVIQYYVDILEDAAKYGLLVNFHGATLPRGWSRTYPHLMTVEAVRGFEMVTFSQYDADRQAEICTVLPFTRNVFDPMDYTPMNLHKVQSSVQRKTSPCFELATSIVFLSGIQHYAESPEGMQEVSSEVCHFLRNLPNHWDDVRFLSGYPGKEVVIARRSGEKWYVAGINGETKDKVLKLDLTPLKTKKGIQLFADGRENGSIVTQKSSWSDHYEVKLGSNGGFVLLIE